MTAAGRLTWLAARDGIGHAFRGADLRALCGSRRFSERYAWPRKISCDICAARVGAMAETASTVAPESESELREAWGGR